MPCFKPVTLSDISWIKPLIFKNNTQNADFSFSNIYTWIDHYKTESTRIDGCLVVRTVKDGLVGYSFPVDGLSDDGYIAVVEVLRDFSLAKGEVFRLQSISNKQLPLFDRYFPGQYDIFPDIEHFDYVYDSRKLITLAGKKLHAKRNYINRFIKEFSNWSFEPITEDCFSECLIMYNQWAGGKHDAFETIPGETAAFEKAMSNFTALELDGGILRINGGICAFTVGERLSPDTYVVHFEKALPELPGAYQMINREFVRHICEKYPEIAFINREEDLGLENLKKAKRSYYPDLMVEKYVAILK